ncbi:MAG: F0F1 ATP synthase subunit delta [Rhodococcus sp. (in: high G+C Gram-positive bacteria)]|jgi:F-type H+-transporting ATPase subunit delta|uniref:F0F1 ATP synthase subunit delta n=1 Tax=Rhodococcus sp. EPR-157 TaxID=1813677 RepID=UPI0007BB0F6A|nr:F0F1 ATP synthase subunit delta [Rhodococcus sp. EPR-157]KZF11648.1 F0F1 ATP synthase subunit delta [Rhodococcus sp. EPR-157]
MYATSREALARTRSVANDALGSASAGQATAAAAQTGAELFAVVETLDGQRTLRTALSDASVSAERRSALAEELFAGQVSEITSKILKTAVTESWSKASDLLNSLVVLGREALLRAAADQDQLDTVEDELFRLGRIVAANPQLEQALSDLGKPVQAKRELLGRLLYGKVTAVTEALAIQAVSRLRKAAPADALDELAGLAAQVRDRAVAHVRSAAPLSDSQLEKLTATLTRTYGKPVTVHVEVDAELLSGLVVRIGDEVIDGSGAGRLAALRKTLK